VVFVAALLIRLLFFAVFFHLRPIEKVWSTGLEQGHVANSLAAGRGFSSPFGVETGPTAWIAPVYAGFLALLFKLFGAYSAAAAWSVLVLNALCASGTAWAMYAVGQRVFGRHVGVIAAWIWALSPDAVILSIKVWETSLSALVVVLGALLYWWLRERAGSTRAWTIWGFYWSLTVLASPNVALFFPILSVGAAWRTRGNAVAKLALSAVIFCGVLSPWIVRNYVRLHAIFPVRSDFWEELWLGNHEGVRAFADESRQPLGDPRELEQYRAMGERDFMFAKRQAALTFIFQHPVAFSRLTLDRIPYFWTSPEGSLWVVIAIAAFYGLLLALRSDFLLFLPFAVALLIYPTIYYVTHVHNFERHPIEPELILLTVFAACSRLPNRGLRSEDRVPASSPIK
jgi:4-amino-4-deoxy-L-arabinose transferase-like glycosyltransferase